MKLFSWGTYVRVDTTKTRKRRGDSLPEACSTLETLRCGMRMARCRLWTEQKTSSSAVRGSHHQLVQLQKLTVVKGGENISSVALESILATHPEILEAGVIAVEDSRWGECPKAFITIKKGTLLTGEDVIRWARSGNEMSKFMVPREVEVVDELPKTSTGKIRKNILREWAKGGPRKHSNGGV